MVGGGWRGELHFELLARHVGERAHPPRREWVTVEGISGPIFGRVGDGVAVPGGLDSNRAALLHDGGEVIGRAGKEVETIVVGVTAHRCFADLFGVAEVLAHTAPTARLATVLVGDDQVGVGHGRVEQRRTGGQITRVQHRCGRREQPGRSRVVQTFAVAIDHGGSQWRSADDRSRVRHAEGGHGRWVRQRW